MRRARDPALFFSIYLDKHSAPTGSDPRRAVLEEVDRFVEKYKLKVDVTPRLHSNAVGIDLANVHSTPSEYHLLFRAQTQLGRPPSGTFYQCVAYLYTDALVLQFALSRFSDWVGALTSGWNEVVAELRAGFDGTVLDAAHEMTFGASAVYWTIADGPNNPEEYADEVRVLADNKRLLRTPTDLGPLWQCERPLFPGVRVSQDLWMLVTPRTAEPEVNKRYHRPRVEYPPNFAVVALAGHKIQFESQQYVKMGEEMGPLYQALDEGSSRILEVQAELGRELDELRSEKAVDFQQTLAAEAHRLADYRNQIGRAKGLRRTLIINRRNYLINSVALISSRGARQVERSREQEQAAAKFLDSCGEEEIFSTNLGQFQGKWNQLDSDLDYANSVVDRYASALQSATDQLWIAGERELGEIAHHISVDSAAVVASVAAILIVELVVKPNSEHGSPSPLANVWELAIAVVIGSFALTQVLSSGCRGKSLEKHSLALAFGFVGAWLASFPTVWSGSLGRAGPVPGWIWQAAGLILGFLAGEVLHPRLSHWLERRRRRDFHEPHVDHT